MATIFDCKGDTCIEALLETTISGIGCFLSLNAFKRIVKDRNNLLNRTNKIIFGLGMIQLAFLAGYFLFWGSDLIISSIRCLRLVTEAMICSVLVEIVLEEEYYLLIQKILKIILAFVFVEWFWTAIINQSVYEQAINVNYYFLNLHLCLYSYFCLEMDYLLLSSTTLIFSLCSAYLGITALQLIKSFQEETSYDEMSNKQQQIKLLIGANFISAFFQFIWDYVAYTNAHTIEDCKVYYEAQSLIGAVGFTILKFITLMLSPLTIYYVFYHIQRNQFNTSTAKELSPEVFFDRRSELIKNLTTMEMQSLK